MTRQDYPLIRSTKVFVADAASTDDTVALALSFRPTLDIHILPGGMPSVGRNRGARAGNAQFTLFLDADVELQDPTLIRRALEAAQRRKFHCVTVDIQCKDGRPSDRWLYRGNNRMQRLSQWFLPFGTGMFLLFQSARFHELGGFSEDALFAEDYLLTKQVSPLRFAVLNGEVWTSNRRFQRTGRLRMVTLFFWTLLNSNNRRHFQRDHGYWRPAAAKAANS